MNKDYKQAFLDIENDYRIEKGKRENTPSLKELSDSFQLLINSFALPLNDILSNIHELFDDKSTD